ncbi:MAG: hypothetical protein LBS21_07815, partial [Clostridiales bacterium]|jgi:hypothetical protein|nr:hypothetical protein [Clostridiales bacterium]
LELIVKAIDIGYNKNKGILKRNADLYGYAYFISQVGRFQKNGMDLDGAIKSAANYCIEQRILYDILTNLKNKELINMIKFEYDEKVALEVAREEGMEMGIEVGREEGIEVLIGQMLRNGKTAEAISSFTDIPLSKVLKVREIMLVNA